MRIVPTIFTSAFLFVLALHATASDTNEAEWLSALPVAAQSSISAALGRDLPEYHARLLTRGLTAQNSAQKLTAYFETDGVRIESGSLRWGMSLIGYGYDDSLIHAQPVAPHVLFNRVEYRRGPLTEWYVNGPVGLEQGFTIAERPSIRGRGTFVIALALSGDLKAIKSGRTRLTLTDRGEHPVLRYTGLMATDASGRKLATSLHIARRQLLLTVSDKSARYPIVVDPIVQVAKLTASDGASAGYLGRAVSISDNTIVVGSYGFNSYQGAAYVFVKPNGGWGNMTQTAELTASDGKPGDSFGQAVSINGNTIAVGAPNATVGSNLDQGAAYVFVKPPTGWTNMTETAKLVASDGAYYDFLGISVGVCGQTVVVGAPQFLSSRAGAAYIFSKPQSGWKSVTETAKLTASDGKLNDSFGNSVAIAADTAVIGAPDASFDGHQYLGAGYVFVMPPTGWISMTQTAKLSVALGMADEQFGSSVAISPGTILVGAPGDNSFQGAAYVFVEPATGWVDMKQTAKLTASDGVPSDFLGVSVSITGKIAVVGAPAATNLHGAGPGAAYVFVGSDRGWRTTSKFNFKLTASDGTAGDDFGRAVMITGNSVVVGADSAKIGSNGLQGAAYVFMP